VKYHNAVTPINKVIFLSARCHLFILKDSVFVALLSTYFSFFTNAKTFDGTEVWVARVYRVFILLSFILTDYRRVIKDKAFNDKCEYV